MFEAVGARFTDATDLRQKLWGGINWAVQRGHLNPIFSPPVSLPETLKLKRVGCPLDDTQILA